MTINYVAWWGATVATLVLLWDVVKWFNTGAKLKCRLQANTAYTNLVQPGSTGELIDYCHIELTNTGTTPTTVTDIQATHSPGKQKGQVFSTSVCFLSNSDKSLPTVIGPGELWSCRFKCADGQEA